MNYFFPSILVQTTFPFERLALFLTIVSVIKVYVRYGFRNILLLFNRWYENTTDKYQNYRKSNIEKRVARFLDSLVFVTKRKDDFVGLRTFYVYPVSVLCTVYFIGMFPIYYASYPFFAL